jgi:uncharacterized membrane protein (DUF4010 family)
MTVEMPSADLVIRLVLVLGLAVFLGFAFEEMYKRDDRRRPGGIRTFPVLALCGALLYLIDTKHALAFVAGLVAVALWLQAHIRETPRTDDPSTSSLMIPACNLLAYVLGAIALAQPPWVAVAVCITAVLLLGAREQLHRFVRVVPQDELLTAGKFLVLAGIVLPLVPNEPVTDITPLTPYQAWLAVVAVAGLSYASYLVQRYVPFKEGALLPALLGGLYSSTATTVVLAKRQREAGPPRADLSAAIIAATGVMFLRLAVIVTFFDRRLAFELAPALAALFAASAAVAAFEWRNAEGGKLDVTPRNPLQLSTALIFAGLFVVISVASSWIGGVFGETGVFALAAAVGTTDIDPFVITIAQGGLPQIPGPAHCAAILIAASSNNLVKGGAALLFGGVAGAKRPAAALILISLLGFAAGAAYML